MNMIQCYKSLKTRINKSRINLKCVPVKLNGMNVITLALAPAS